MSRSLSIALLASVSLAACVEQPSGKDHEMMRHDMMAAKQMPLFDNLGTHRHKISTQSKEAQAFFDQGYRLLFNFNHAAAIASFEEALKRDPGCAMCWWGISLAHGPNINMPMLPDAQAPALHALEMAQSLSAHASPVEREYIDALSKRYSSDPKVERPMLDKAFAEAVGKLARRHPDDLDAQVLYAEALMDTSPWDYWQADHRTPKAGFERLVPGLEGVMKRSPRHPGAIHLYIHAVEASTAPGRAEKYADVLGTLLPGAGHLVHMPTHIYNRIGRYDDGVRWNQKAAKADEAYFDATQDRGMYAGMYYVHNLHFVWTASTTDGRSALAREYAHKVVESLDPGMVQSFPSAQIFVPTELYAALRFGDWDSVLRAPAPNASLHFATSIWHYARSRAFAAKGDTAKAVAESALIAASFSEDDAKNFQNFGVPGEDLVRIAGHVARSEIARAKGVKDDAVNELRAAVKAQDNLPYTEPPWWDFPTRQFLGDALMQAGRYKEAVETYRQDLKQWPKNGWSLYGLARALEHSGHAREAKTVWVQFKKSWTRADVTLSSSRL
ncbi:MAG: tetratricopeptide repeat protein [Micropepsaceae bacterium]